ncbi:MAG TPA: hypothetical protein VNQ80_09905 [Parapedobacter sp.]|uniref:hypothetical protein n=1 Tax=Parapedobacter sp. TaxID=1958893 RepID=UPI002D197A70|nr:hypothetical protein [Parapedobacter sp.]HWK57643.1 hypothetical protein [Parapedobacter sp.]
MRNRSNQLFLSVLAVAFVVIVQAQTRVRDDLAKSKWVSLDANDKLQYQRLPQGDQIMDFSHAGYKGGGIALPDIAVRITVKPSETGDDTKTIQAAIDKVSAMQPDDHGFRGAILLTPGTFTCSETITITASGVVLRGSGTGLDGPGSTIQMVGGKHTAIVVSRPRNRGTEGVTESAKTVLADRYVPSGSTVFTVESTAGLAAGDTIQLRRPVTNAWIEFMEMHNLVRDGKPQTWLREGTRTVTERRINAVEGNQITVDVPLTDSYNAVYLNPPGTEVVKISEPNRLNLCAVEYLRIVSPPQPFNHAQQLYAAIRLNGEDCWMRHVRIEETMNSVNIGGQRITLQEVSVIRKARHEGSSKPSEFSPNGGQVLLDRCSVEGDNVWFAATGGGISGPIVLLNCTFQGNGRIEGHQRWTTGILLDNCRLPDGGIDFKNRGSMGSGHGWGTGWSVAWNCVAKSYVVQQPPGTHNWAIGCIGESTPLPRPFDRSLLLPEGTFDAHGTPVTPQSLYLTQLEERLGKQALINIGYP